MEVTVPQAGVKISGQQAVKDVTTLTRTEQQEETRELTLPGPDAGVRRYALWQRPNELHIDAVGARKGQLFWRNILTETFNSGPAIIVNSDADT